MQRLGVVSDTHLTSARAALPDPLLEALAGVDGILHAGDLVCQAVLDRLQAIAPVWSVHGNVDPSDLQWRLPDRLVLTVEEVTIGITHGHLGKGESTPARALSYFAAGPRVNLIVFGHSHEPYNRRHGGVLLFNPGSPTQPRRQPRPSYGMLEIEGDRLRAALHYL